MCVFIPKVIQILVARGLVNEVLLRVIVKW